MAEGGPRGDDGGAAATFRPRRTGDAWDSAPADRRGLWLDAAAPPEAVYVLRCARRCSSAVAVAVAVDPDPTRGTTRICCSSSRPTASPARPATSPRRRVAARGSRPPSSTSAATAEGVQGRRRRRRRRRAQRVRAAARRAHGEEQGVPRVARLREAHAGARRWWPRVSARRPEVARAGFFSRCAKEWRPPCGVQLAMKSTPSARCRSRGGAASVPGGRVADFAR